MSAPSGDELPGAVVLAGGLARRMGGRSKGLVSLNGRPMLSWVTQAIAPAVSRIVINANRERDAHATLGHDVVPDLHPDHPGPLAGLAAGLAALDTPRVFMCPCDSPFIDAELVRALSRGLDGAPDGVSIACAHDGDRLQPVFALVEQGVADSLNDWLARGERKIDAWYAEQGYVAVDCSAFSDAFVNINTEQDREAAERRLITVP